MIQMHVRHDESSRNHLKWPTTVSTEFIEEKQNLCEIVGKSIAISRAHVATKVYICQTNENATSVRIVCSFQRFATHAYV